MPHIKLVGSDTYNTLTRGFKKGVPVPVSQEEADALINEPHPSTGGPLFSYATLRESEELDLIAAGINPDPNRPARDGSTTGVGPNDITSSEVRQVKPPLDVDTGSGIDLNAEGRSDAPLSPEDQAELDALLAEKREEERAKLSGTAVNADGSPTPNEGTQTPPAGDTVASQAPAEGSDKPTDAPAKSSPHPKPRTIIAGKSATKPDAEV